VKLFRDGSKAAETPGEIPGKRAKEMGLKSIQYWMLRRRRAA